jgi:hypothetical protein
MGNCGSVIKEVSYSTGRQAVGGYWRRQLAICTVLVREAKVVGLAVDLPHRKIDSHRGDNKQAQ